MATVDDSRATLEKKIEANLDILLDEGFEDTQRAFLRELRHLVTNEEVFAMAVEVETLLGKVSK